MKPKKLNSQRGSSIILAVLLTLVVALFCSSLFYILSSSSQNVGQERDREQAMLLAQSLSDNIRSDVEEKEASSLGLYLKENLGVSGSGWGYYNPDEVFNSNKTAVTRTFTQDLNETDLKGNAEIAIYWMSDGETEMKQEFSGNKRTMYIVTTVTVEGAAGSQKASVTAVYDYSLESEADKTYWWTYRGGM